MRVLTFSALFLLIAIYFVIAVAAEVFIDEYVRPRTMFASLLAGTILTGIAALAINYDVPD